MLIKLSNKIDSALLEVKSLTKGNSKFSKLEKKANRYPSITSFMGSKIIDFLQLLPIRKIRYLIHFNKFRILGVLLLIGFVLSLFYNRSIELYTKRHIKHVSQVYNFINDDEAEKDLIFSNNEKNINSPHNAFQFLSYEIKSYLLQIKAWISVIYNESMEVISPFNFRESSQQIVGVEIDGVNVLDKKYLIDIITTQIIDKNNAYSKNIKFDAQKLAEHLSSINFIKSVSVRKDIAEKKIIVKIDEEDIVAHFGNFYIFKDGKYVKRDNKAIVKNEEAKAIEHITPYLYCNKIAFAECSSVTSKAYSSIIKKIGLNFWKNVSYISVLSNHIIAMHMKNEAKTIVKFSTEGEFISEYANILASLYRTGMIYKVHSVNLTVPGHVFVTKI